jgi:hypothetical protein
MKEDVRKDDLEGHVPQSEKPTHDPAGQITNEIVIGADGFKLFPQPVLDDQLDPLNWSFARKHTILSIVMAL